MELRSAAPIPNPQTLAGIFRSARGSLSLRAFVKKIGVKDSAYTTLARVERGEVEIPSDDILAAVSPYTKPYKSVLELKAIALGVPIGNGTDTPKYESVLLSAQALCNADKVRLVKALVEDLGRH